MSINYSEIYAPTSLVIFGCISRFRLHFMDIVKLRTCPAEQRDLFVLLFYELILVSTVFCSSIPVF